MKVAINILRGVIIVLLSGIVVINLWIAVQKLVLHRDPPSVFGYSRLVVATGSMEPEFSAGDTIYIKAKDSYELGEVVTFRDSAGDLVTHRLVGRTEGLFVTQGDANNVEDRDLLPPENIVGAVVTYLPSAALLDFLHAPLGMLILVVVGVLLIGLPSWLGDLRQKERGRHAREED